MLSALSALSDIAGALLLARALVFVRTKSLMEQSTSGWGGVSPALVKMFSEQQVDAASGLTCLLVGFSLQCAVGLLGLQSTSRALFSVGFVVLLIAGAIYFAVRRPVTRWIFERACRTYAKPDGSRVWTDEQIGRHWDRLGKGTQ